MTTRPRIYEQIKDTSATLPRVKGEEVAKAIGAVIGGPVPQSAHSTNGTAKDTSDRSDLVTPKRR